MPTISVKRVVDTTGAGDAFLGGIIAGDDVILNDVIVMSPTSHSDVARAQMNSIQIFFSDN